MRGYGKNIKTDMAPWSSGQDASLSRWNQGFDSPRSHLRSTDCSVDFFVVSVMKRSLRSIHLGKIFYKSISPENGNDLFEV